MIASQPQKHSGSVKVVPAASTLTFTGGGHWPRGHLTSFPNFLWDHYDFGDKNYPTIKIEDDRGNPIAYIDRSDRAPAVSAANARLIARAPDLLNLARKLVIVCDDRLAELREESAQRQDSDITERMNHYVSLKHEAESCIAEIH